MCQKKPGLRCSQHSRKQISSLQKQKDQAIADKDASRLKKIEASLSDALLEFHLTQDGLKKLAGSQLEKYQNIRAQRQNVAKRLNAPIKVNVYEIPSQYHIQGEETQYEKLEMDYQEACNVDKDLRQRLTDNINMRSKRYSQDLLNRTAQSTKLVQQLKWYKSLVQTIKAECDRQHVGPDRVQFLSNAYAQASQQAKFQSQPTLKDMELYAGILEPDSHGRVRFTNVTFANGGSAASGDVAYSATERLFSYLDDETDPDDFVHAYLQIHPFQDGNGRSAWLLRTWLRDEWDDPQPLPYYNFS